MGLSVTAANLIFAIALLGAFSVASAEYWRTTEALHEARRDHDERLLAAAHANLTLSGYSWSSELQALDFTLRNSGTTPLDHTRFQYLFDGVLSFASQSASYPHLNGQPNPTSSLLLPGETLDCRFPLATQPAKVQVVTEFGSIYAHYP